jgi:hypothetical protein
VALGSLRDHVYDARGGVFSFEPGLAPRLADAAGWLSIALVVQLAMRIGVGPARADALRGARESGT